MLCTALSLLLSACGTMEPTGPSKEPPRYRGVKIGEPYSVAGTWYKPEEDAHYDKTGLASWYGPGFNGKPTANGEIFNQYDITAAHPTLPMPSFVRVTNLENGKQAVVRINDRGPFHRGRIIDLSKASAEKLGIKGTSPVRVQYLKEETSIYIASNGTIWPHDLQPETQMAGDNIMPRETMSLTPAQDAHYYKVDETKLEAAAESHDFKPAPLEIANNQGSVVSSAPVLSVSTSNEMPTLIKPAMAEEAPPYPSALTQKPEINSQAIPEDVYGRDTELSKKEKPKSPPMISGEGAVPQAKPHQSLPEGGLKQAWSVQIASFSERVNAERLTEKLAVLGQPELQPVLVDGREWFRVYLHPASSKISKEELLAELQKMGLRDARIVH